MGRQFQIQQIWKREAGRFIWQARRILWKFPSCRLFQILDFFFSSFPDGNLIRTVKFSTAADWTEIKSGVLFALERIFEEDKDGGFVNRRLFVLWADVWREQTEADQFRLTLQSCCFTFIRKCVFAKTVIFLLPDVVLF